MNNIEVELRGPLDDKGYLVLQKYLEDKGKHTSTQKRLFFDLSQTIGINNRTLDVRVKVTNGKIQIVTKRGEPGSASREEAEVSVEATNLHQALHVLSLLGYPKGVYGDRKIERYTVGEVEFAIQDVLTTNDEELHSRFYEAEIMSHADNKSEAEGQLRSLLTEIGLPVFDTEEWNEYEAMINKEANGWFDYSSTDISRFANPTS
ncbi:MAG: hypothetical protein WC217_00115 [Candidatus Paceibacterota bacterium]|jgi:adenylate cyclase class IV